MHKPKTKEQIVRQLKIVEGQVRALQGMVASGKYCIDIITQTSAVKRALSSAEDALMENHLNCCATDQVKKGKGSKMADEILKVYRLKRK
ncbi:MAG: metal-sensitive transcriptional regulator [Patescibacteria group bacterium]